MAVLSLTGSDVCTLTGGTPAVTLVMSDFADGNVAELTFDNEIANMKTGWGGNAVYALNATGNQCTFKVRLVRGSPDDIAINKMLAAQQADFASTVLLTGSFVKSTGDGAGNVKKDTYTFTGGVFMKQVDGKTNTDGDVEQSVAVYTIKFADAPRTPSA